MKRVLVLSCTILILFIACANPEMDPQTWELEKPAIRLVLDQQVAGWNKGDLHLFMDGYLKSDSLRFASGGNVRYGWETTLKNYQRGYPDKATMGFLTFSKIDIKMISFDTALIFGKWHLQREADEPWGLFTLIMKNTQDGWRVAYDHTSSAKE